MAANSYRKNRYALPCANIARYLFCSMGEFSILLCYWDFPCFPVCLYPALNSIVSSRINTFCPLAASDSVLVCSRGPAVPSRGQKTLQLLQIPLLLPLLLPTTTTILLLLLLRLLLLRLRLRLLLLELFGSLLPIVSSLAHGHKRSETV